jgi:iron(III) transport system substrate-binding protein
MQNTLFFINYKALQSILILIFVFAPVNSFGHSSNGHAEEEVNVYSGRKGKLIEPMLKKFENKTGIKVNLITAKSDALIKRMESEGESSPADLFVTVDVGRLDRAKRMGLLQKINSFSIVNKLPQNYIDKDREWVGISKRIRTVVISKKMKDKNNLKNFEDLSKDQWAGRICVRSSNNIYNQSLVASLIANHGEKKAEVFVKKLVKNFARKPSGNDRAQIAAIAKGECDIAIVNHYYYILMLNSKESEKKKAANETEIIFLNQDNRGAHVNISGVGIPKHAKNYENAKLLISYMLDSESQEWYAKTNNEYPVIKDAKVSQLLNSWGSIKLDESTLNKLGDLNPNAVKLMDRVGWQ